MVLYVRQDTDVQFIYIYLLDLALATIEKRLGS